ncbi:MAG TPA: YciI family protein [Candidatus Limnocylindrales bacterium]|nr:YciI family protein [Candidatus Limnocylindrales bacterium]
MKLDVYTVVLLRRPAGAPQLSQAELDRLQAEHVAFNARMREEGHALVTGPFTGQPDPSLRGFDIFRTSVEETRRLTSDDPLVRAGRLVLDIFTWLVPVGTLGDRPAAQIDDD